MMSDSCPPAPSGLTSGAGEGAEAGRAGPGRADRGCVVLFTLANDYSSRVPRGEGALAFLCVALNNCSVSPPRLGKWEESVKDGKEGRLLELG